MQKVKVIDKKSENSIKYERALLSQLNYPFIVNMHYAFQDYDHLYLVLDLLTGGDLRYHVSRHRKFSEKQTQFFIACLIQALEYIHSKRVIHRDIKPENLVFDDKGYVHVTDFGIAKRFSNKNNHETSGTPGYMAPEVMRAQNHTYLVDYFAVGVMGYEFMLGKRPYIGKNRKEIKEQIMARQAEIKEEELPYGWNVDSADFINRLLQRKPECRLGYNGVQEIKEHNWFREFPWDDLVNKRMSSPFIPERKENYDKRYCESSEKIGMETSERYEKYRNSQRYHLIFEGFFYCEMQNNDNVGMGTSMNSNKSSNSIRIKYNSRTIDRDNNHSRAYSYNNNNNNNVSTSNSSVCTYKYRNARNNNGTNSNGSCISNSNNNINTNKQSVKSYDYNHYELEFKKATSYNNAIKERIERNNSHNNITFKDSNSSTNNANSKRKRCSSALNGVYSPNHYNYMLDKDNKHNSVNSSTINNSNSHILLQKNISNINLIPSSLTNRTNSVSSIRKANPTTNINIPNSHKPPTASYNQPHRYTNNCSNILQSNTTQHRRFNSISSKELKSIDIETKSTSSNNKMSYQGIKSYIPKGNTNSTSNNSGSSNNNNSTRSTQLQKYLINNNIAHLTLNHQFINTSAHNNIHNNISYSVVNNPNHNVNNSTNTIQYKYQLGRPPLSSMSSSNSASKTRIPLPSSPRNGIASAMNSNNTSSSNINYYLSGNHTTTNHNSISRQSSSHLRMNSTGGNNNNSSVRTNSNNNINNSLHSSRKNYCLHKNNSVYNLSKCIPSSNTCSRPNISSSLNQQTKRNNATNVFKSYKVSSSSSYSTNASANKNAK